jgi:polysaccharide export outer membrane protein
MQGDSNASGDVVVRPDGRISLPLIGDIQAAGLTPTALQQAVTAALSRYWTNPLVTVQVKEVKSRNVFVIGQVVRPGAYPLRGPMTVLQLLATAGGLTDFARKDAVAIVRQVDGMTVSIPFDYAGVVSGQQLEQNIALAPGDTVVVR